MAAIKVCDPCAAEKKLNVAGWRVRLGLAGVTYHTCSAHRNVWRGKPTDVVFTFLKLGDNWLNDLLTGKAVAS